MDAYNVIWDTPSKDSSGSMPIGNGDIGANVWVEENGDLVFYISKTDAWAGSGELFKLGGVRVSLTPGLIDGKKPFRQELRVGKGEISIKSGDTELLFWIDTNHPVIHIEAESPKPFTAKCALETWRDDSVLADKSGRITWYHRNSTSIYPDTLTHQGLKSMLADFHDPLMNRTFGCAMIGDEMKLDGDRTLVSDKPGKHLHIAIYPLTTQTDSAQGWVDLLNENITAISKQPLDEARKEHHRWWNEFSNRSWINVTGSTGKEEIVSRGYALQRFINACGGRGGSPIKFNGSIFNVDGREPNEKYNADSRRWGGAYWFQNTRLPYWSMVEAGDFDLMQPLFRMFLGAVPFTEKRAEIYYGHSGAFFPETMYFWGINTNGDYDFGNKDRTGLPDSEVVNPYVRYYWTGGLELSVMMLDYYATTGDREFVKETLLPIASPVIEFFDKHWKRDANGKIRFEPAGSLETWQVSVNPLPEIAGLDYLLKRMLAELPADMVSEAERAEWQRILTELPPIPIKEENGATFILPAEKFDQYSNTENPELYAVFPYRIFGAGKPGFATAMETWKRRLTKRTGGWSNDPMQAAYLGLADEAAKDVAFNFSTKHEGSRFPAFWGPNFDWIPDQDHGSVAMVALQRMLLQSENGKIQLLPAWPRDWDVDFKLHAAGKTTVECTYKNGKIERLKVTPESRAKDVEFLGAQVSSPAH